MGFKRRTDIQGTIRTRWHKWGTRTRAASRADVMRALWEMSEGGTRGVQLRDVPSKLRRALLFHFDSFVAAREAAGVPAYKSPPRWNRALIREELRQAHEAGVRMTQRGLKDAERFDLMGAIQSVYGSLPAAREDAGVPHPPRAKPRVRMSWSPEIVLISIIELWEAGESLAYSKAPPTLTSAATRYFGSWESALAAVGLDYAEIRLVREAYGEEDILKILRQLARERPDMTISELRAENTALAARALQFFGSLDDAIVAAGIVGWPVRIAQPIERSKADVITRIRARERRGESNRAQDVAAEDWPLFNSATHVFWNWNEARQAAGLPPTPQNFRWSQERVVEELQERAARGEVLAREVGANLRNAARKYFGSLAKARRAAGIRPPRRVRRKRGPGER